MYQALNPAKLLNPQTPLWRRREPYLVAAASMASLFLLCNLYAALLPSHFPAPHPDAFQGEPFLYTAFGTRVLELRATLASHATHFEQVIFERIALRLTGLAVGLTPGPTLLTPGSTEGGLLYSLAAALLHITFLIIWWARLWIIGGLAAAAWYGAHAVKPYVGKNILGQMGNGRLFFSGVRAKATDAADFSDSGAPKLLVRGVTCLPELPLKEAQSSKLWQLLLEFGVDNATNTTLVQFLLADPSFPAYAYSTSERGLPQPHVPLSLTSHTEQILRAALSTHRALGAPAPRAQGPLAAQALETPQSEAAATTTAAAATPKNKQGAKGLKAALMRSLTPLMQAEITKLSPEAIATIVLGLQAGKLLAYSKSESSWVRRSLFPLLSSRAVLHSIPAFATDYSCAERHIIRRALVFGSREVIFAPVALPSDLCPITAAARQWVELLSGDPKRLLHSAIETELFGIMYESHRCFVAAMTQAITEENGAALGSSFSTAEDHLLIPLPRLMEVLTSTTEPSTIARLLELAKRSRVLAAKDAAKQATGTAFSGSSKSKSQDVKPSGVTCKPLLSDEELVRASTKFGISPAEMQQWAAFKLFLDVFGWLAYRVNSATIPEHGLANVVVHLPSFDSKDPLNEVIGSRLVVPLRASRLKAVIGSSAWENAIPQALWLEVAREEEDLDSVVVRLKSQVTTAKEAKKPKLRAIGGGATKRLPGA